MYLGFRVPKPEAPKPFELCPGLGLRIWEGFMDSRSGVREAQHIAA